MSSIISSDLPAHDVLRNHAHKEDIRAYWSRRAETFDNSSGHRIEDTAEAPAWQALFTDALGPLEGKRVLDLACGTGEISRMLLALGADVTGVDFAEPMLQRARRKHAGKSFSGRLADVENLRMEEDASYDAIVNRHLVWTLVDPHAAFAEWARILKPGGRMLVIDGDWVNTPWYGRAIRALADKLSPKNIAQSGFDAAEHDRLMAGVHYRRGLRPDELASDLARHGFRDARRHSMNPVYIVGMRKAPLADWMRLNAASRFAVSVAR
jgi:ubiquinone/menaquinone biosynthesis C-methylase UbiE